MVARLSKPEITNIEETTDARVKTHWQFWVLAVVTPVLSIIIFLWLRKAGADSDNFRLVVFPLLFFFAYLAGVQGRVRASFWKQFAKANGWKYKKRSNSEQEGSIMFKKGIHSPGGKISNLIEGGVDGRQFRIFSYSHPADEKAGDNVIYTVFAFKFDGSFPHIYLSNENNPDSDYLDEISRDLFLKSAGEQINLPAKFQKEFSLYVPKKYEMEALEIFTTDVLNKLLDVKLHHDVELVDQEVLIFTYGAINSFEELEKEFNLVLEIEDLLDEKLDRFKFNQIGDLPCRL